jgi:uncharacterized membrane protein YkoI
MKHIRSLIAATLLLPAVIALPAQASGDEHEEARRALERGEVLPLTRILEIAEAETQGRVIEVDFERDDGVWLYELELLTPDGRLMELEIDGASGRVLESEYDD